MKNLNIMVLLAASVVLASCGDARKPKFTGARGEVKLITLAPGHFHAALVQKDMYPEVSPDVYVYAEAGDDLNQHLARIRAYNERAVNPTSWNEIVYHGPDFLEKMLSEKRGNVMVTAGNNGKKIDWIKQTIDAGINVLADKPMVIDVEGFAKLKEAFASAQQHGVLLYDIMTERFEITTILQKEFSLSPEVFGTLVDGTPDEPAVSKESVHLFAKFVSGTALKRPPWFFDVTAQGEGIVDVTTHLVDLVQWECFPNVVLDCTKDIEIVAARRWPTALSRQQFQEVTGLTDYPDYLKKYVANDTLYVYSNGEIDYRLKGKMAKIVVVWDYSSPGGSDRHYSIMRGTNARLIIRQTAEQNYRPELYIEPVNDATSLAPALAAYIKKVQAKYPGVELQKNDAGWQVTIPDTYRNGHEAHFGQVTANFLSYLKAGKLPDWEVPNMIAKYYTTTKALEVAKGEK